MSGIDAKGLLQSVDLAAVMAQNSDNGIPALDYLDTNVSEKVVQIIQSYVGVLKKILTLIFLELALFAAQSIFQLLIIKYHYMQRNSHVRE